MSTRLLPTTTEHTRSLFAFVEKAYTSIFDIALGAGSRIGWDVAAERVVLSVLRNITRGQLTVKTPSSTYVFPENPAESSAYPQATLQVRSPMFFLRLLASGDLGFSESFMFGEIDIDPDDLIKMFEIFILNKSELQGLTSSLITQLLSVPFRFTAKRFLNSVSNSQANISAHYDLGNAMFEGFLSEDMTYSCAIFPTLDADVQPNTTGIQTLGQLTSHTKSTLQSPNATGVSTPTTAVDPAEQMHSCLYEDKDDLYEAQMRKLRHIIKRADIRPGMRVLEIGSGWGSMSLLITTTIPDTQVDTLTLSVHQAECVRSVVQRRSCEVKGGLEERVRVHLMDYRSMPPEWEGTFDRVVSVEMVEAVGQEYLETYFRTIDWALKKDTGVGVVQGITIPEGRYNEYAKGEDFIRKWIFPGGILPTLTLLTNTITTASAGRLLVDSVSNIGPHYARTLREWRRRFENGFGEGGIIENALRNEYPDVMDGPQGKQEIEVFRRKWIYYFCYCEVGFTTRTLGDHIIAFTREGNQEYGCQVFE